MSVIARALRLSWRDRLDAARALGWLVAVHAGLHLLPYQRVRRFVARVGHASSPRPMTPEGCGKAVARASVLFPPAACLARAIAAECLLKRAGHEPQLKIAAGFDETHAFSAHAWLVSDGIVVTGGGERPGLREL